LGERARAPHRRGGPWAYLDQKGGGTPDTKKFVGMRAILFKDPRPPPLMCGGTRDWQMARGKSHEKPGPAFGRKRLEGGVVQGDGPRGE